MKGIIKLLLLVVVSSPALQANANPFENEDDSYIGFQISIPIGETPGKFAQTNFEYSFMVLDKTDGITTGMTWAHDNDDHNTLGFLPPNNTFEVGKSQVSDYSLPLLSDLDGVDLSMKNSVVIDGAVILAYTIGGIYVVAKVLDDVFDDIDDDLDDDEDEEEEEEEEEDD